MEPRGPRTSRAGPLTLEGELVASSTGHASSFAPGERVFHQKFGYGLVAEVDGNKLTIDFDKAGRKRVVDSFVTRADKRLRRARAAAIHATSRQERP